jgi:hypothetical protein
MAASGESNKAVAPAWTRLLARVGWVGIVLSLVAAVVNQNEMQAVVRTAGCELCPVVGIIGTLFGWFVTGFVLVAGDTLRPKGRLDRWLWAAAAIAYALSCFWIADDVLRLRWIPTSFAAYGLIFVVVVAATVPSCYTLLLTLRAKATQHA